MTDQWEETRARLERFVAHLEAQAFRSLTAQQDVADIRAALQRVQELERALQETRKNWGETSHYLRTAEADIVRLRQRVQELEHESADRAELIDNLLEQKESCQKCIEKALHNKKRAEAAEAKLARCVEAGTHLQHEARLVAIPGRGHLIDAIEMWTSAALAATKGE